MKTNISIDLTDDERIIIVQRFYKTKGKKKITTQDIDIIDQKVEKAINQVGDGNASARKTISPIMSP